jgi:hypothetical protein
VDHFATLFALGVQAVGTSQYPNANAGLSAMENPKSEASRFRAYQLTFDPIGDHSYTSAFNAVSRFYTLQDTPNSLSTWDVDMDNVAVALDKWVSNAPDWQISQLSTAKFQRLKVAVIVAIDRARAEISDVVQGR